VRPLNKIAAEIITLWRDKPPPERTKINSSPYIQAMLDISSCNDMYGLETGDMIVAYALNNIGYWHGEDARRIKAELKEHLESHNARNRRN
jgi:hypothetical protein